MGCGEFVLKYTLFFSNLFFALAGLTLIGLGIAVQLQVTVVTDLFEGAYQMVPILTIIIGSIIFFIAFLGCCGAIRESNCLLVTYAVFMIILMVIKLSLACILFVNLSTFKEQIPIWLNEAFSRPNREPFYALQSALNCCGTQGPTSYGIVATLPPSCCSADPIIGVCTIAEAHRDGCNSKLVDFFDVFGTAIGSVTMIVVAIELVAVIFSLCLANHVRNNTRRGRY